MITIKVRFPNEPYSAPISIDLNEFKVDKEFDDEVFGWYEGEYIAVNREDYEETK